MTLDTTFFLVGILVEAAILGLLIFQRIYKKLPLFTAYVAWSLVSDIGYRLLRRQFPDSEFRIYLLSAVIDACFVFCVLIEISMSVLEPIRSSLPRWTVFAVSGLIAAVCFIIWPFAKSPGMEDAGRIYQWIDHLNLTTAVARVLLFLLLAGLSQLLSLGLRDRELQLATGFGFYSLVGLLAAMLHHSGTAVDPNQFHRVDQIVTASYLISLIYWAFSFSQKVPERREFTPQMQSFLLAIAGGARSTRMAMTDSSSKGDRNPRR
ncbi:hypothetical protein P8935_19860 [Telmatobacter sp. DSM 110680]|uniref:Uncharacterized protein n=1 Tax=Telmatobacter sp. DSM 110680 TaxID=3036704 RepID=A0AAU7DG91_9BACT